MDRGGDQRSATLLGLLGRLAGRPGEDHPELLERCRDAPGLPAEAGRFLTQFADRIGDLSVDERRELYEETLAVVEPRGQGSANGSLVPVSMLGALDEALRRVAEVPHAAADPLLLEHVLPAIERVLPSLEAARNPFALLLKAICFVVLDRLRAAETRPDQPG
jgi:hypothetical protein